MTRTKWSVPASDAGDISTGEGLAVGENDDEEGGEEDTEGGDKMTLLGSGDSGMGLNGLNAIQVYVCPALSLGMINSHLLSRLGEVGEMIGGASDAVMRRVGVFLDQRPRKECGPRGDE